MQQEPKFGSIRAWYRSKTATAIRVLSVFTVVAGIAAVILFATMPPEWTLRLQIFNGAFVIPIAALIWIGAFTYVWLMPMREVSFRGQETMERMEVAFEERLKRVDKILDAAEKADIKKFEEHLAAIRARIERDTAGLPGGVSRRSPVHTP